MKIKDIIWGCACGFSVVTTAYAAVAVGECLHTIIIEKFEERAKKKKDSGKGNWA